MPQIFWCGVISIFVVITVAIIPVTAQPQTADASISKDRALRFAVLKTGKKLPTTPQRGFFGTIFNLILEQINDTKSAYTQISGIVNNQFSDTDVVTPSTNNTNNGTTQAPKISRAELLRILDRNLKGLARLRNLEWREARKDSWANLASYKNEIFSGEKSKKGG